MALDREVIAVVQEPAGASARSIGVASTNATRSFVAVLSSPAGSARRACSRDRRSRACGTAGGRRDRARSARRSPGRRAVRTARAASPRAGGRPRPCARAARARRPSAHGMRRRLDERRQLPEDGRRRRPADQRGRPLEEHAARAIRDGRVAREAAKVRFDARPARVELVLLRRLRILAQRPRRDGDHDHLRARPRRARRAATPAPPRCRCRRCRVRDVHAREHALEHRGPRLLRADAVAERVAVADREHATRCRRAGRPARRAKAVSIEPVLDRLRPRLETPRRVAARNGPRLAVGTGLAVASHGFSSLACPHQLLFTSSLAKSNHWRSPRAPRFWSEFLNRALAFQEIILYRSSRSGTLSLDRSALPGRSDPERFAFLVGPLKKCAKRSPCRGFLRPYGLVCVHPSGLRSRPAPR